MTNFSWIIIIKCNMEKLQATPKTKNLTKGNIITKRNNDIVFDKKNKKTNKNFEKNQQKNKDLSKKFNKMCYCIKNVWCENKVKILTFSILFVATIIFNFFIISNTSFYVFLKKPKILENATLLQMINFIFLLFLIAIFIYEIYLDQSKLLKQSNQKIDLKAKDFDAEIDVNLDKNTNKTFFKTNKKNNKIHKKITKNHKNYAIFKQILIIFSLFLILLLSFWLKLLWLCVFVSFIIFFSLFVLLYRLKHKSSKIFCIVLILVKICILLSFYFIYLLN